MWIQVLQLVSHLVYWGKASVIYPLCESNVYLMSPTSNTDMLVFFCFHHSWAQEFMVQCVLCGSLFFYPFHSIHLVTDNIKHTILWNYLEVKLYSNNYVDIVIFCRFCFCCVFLFYFFLLHCRFLLLLSCFFCSIPQLLLFLCCA